MWGTLGMVNVPKWLLDPPLTSNQLLLLGGALLAVAAVLMVLGRRTRMALQSSLVTEELMLYLARIANALERPQPQLPSLDEITGEVMRRMEEIGGARPDGKVKEIANSMFGREYRRE